MAAVSCVACVMERTADFRGGLLSLVGAGNPSLQTSVCTKGYFRHKLDRENLGLSSPTVHLN